MTMLLNRELVSRAKLRLVIAFPDIVKDCPKTRNLPKIFLRSFENVAPGDWGLIGADHRCRSSKVDAAPSDLARLECPPPALVVNLLPSPLLHSSSLFLVTSVTLRGWLRRESRRSMSVYTQRGHTKVTGTPHTKTSYTVKHCSATTRVAEILTLRIRRYGLTL